MACNNCRFLGPKLETYPGVSVHQCRHDNHAKAVTNSVELAALEMLGKQEGVTACCQCPDKEARVRKPVSSSQTRDGKYTVTEHSVDGHGFGDAVVCGMIAKGLVDSGSRYRLKLLATGRKSELLTVLNVPHSQESKATAFAPKAHPWSTPWAAYWADGLGVPLKTAYLTPTLSQEALDWASSLQIDRKTVLLFPYRSGGLDQLWQQSNWRELASILRLNGLNAVPMLPGRKSDWLNAPVTDWNRIVAAMTLAGVTIGLNSGPVHIAGSIQAKAIALVGPALKIYDHLPNVLSVASSEFSCIGCLATGSKKPVCHSGCLAMFNLLPKTIAAITQRVIESLPEQPLPYKVAS